MPAKRDFSGVRFGRMVAIKPVGSNKGVIWECLCDCGKTINRKTSVIITAISRNSKKSSCGCTEESPYSLAVLAGEPKYFTGIPCKNGHICERRVVGRACVECSKEHDLATRGDRLIYFKEYNKANPEKTKIAQERYREKNRERVLEGYKTYRSRPESKKRRAQIQRDRNGKNRAGGGSVKPEHVSTIFELQKGKCASCLQKLDKYHADHIMPIALGGRHEPANIQILCPDCNLKKGKTHPIDWAKKNGRLL